LTLCNHLVTDSVIKSSTNRGGGEKVVVVAGGREGRKEGKKDLSGRTVVSVMLIFL
jgi:hypothetical protein